VNKDTNIPYFADHLCEPDRHEESPSNVQPAGLVLDFPVKSGSSALTVLQNSAACQNYWRALSLERIEVEVDQIDPTWVNGDTGALAKRISGSFSGQCISIKAHQNEDDIRRMSRLRLYDAVTTSECYRVIDDLILPDALRDAFEPLVTLALVVCHVNEWVPIWGIGDHAYQAQAHGFVQDDAIGQKHPLLSELAQRKGIYRFDPAHLARYRGMAYALKTGGGVEICDPSGTLTFPIRLGRRLRKTVCAFLKNS
jgi:hypothetical protein